MNMNKKAAGLDIKVKLSTLWIVVMFSMVFADIVGFLNPGTLKDMMNGAVGIQITQGVLLAFAVLIEIPIIMIFLSRVLKYKANRWANIIASVITILFVIGGGSPFPYYVFFASVEVVCMLIIIWTVWKWSKPENIVGNKI
jgi:Sec-independent protein secretion pathway component TatC